MWKKLIALILCVQIFTMHLPMSVAHADTIKCDQAASESEKNYCLVKARELDNKGYSWGKLGRDALSISTMTLAIVTAIFTFITPVDAGVGPIRMARQLTPWMLRAGALLYIFAEVYNMVDMKKDCTSLLNNSGSDLPKTLGDIFNKGMSKGVEIDPEVMTMCTGDLMKKEGQLTDFCRAKACVITQTISAKKKVKHLGYVEMAYYGAAALETVYILVNLALGASYTAASIGPQAAAMADKAALCYAYPINKDAQVQDTAVVLNKEKNILENSIKYVNYDFQLRLINQSDTLSSYMVNLQDQERMMNGETSSSSYKDHSNLVFLDKNNRSQFQSLKQTLVQTFTALSNVIVPQAHAKFDFAELMSTFGIAAGVSIALIGPLKKAVGKLISVAWSTPVGRIAYYGALGGLVTANKAVFKNRIVKELENRSSSFDTAIKGLVPPTPTVPPLPTLEAVPTPPSMKPPKLANKPGGANDSMKSCLDADMKADEQCACIRKGNCAKVQIPNSKVDFGGVDVPTVLTSLNKDLENTANDYASGNLSSAELNGASLLNRSGALGHLTKTLKDKVGADMKKAKLAPIDFDGETKKCNKTYLMLLQVSWEPLLLMPLDLLVWPKMIKRKLKIKLQPDLLVAILWPLLQLPLQVFQA